MTWRCAIKKKLFSALKAILAFIVGANKKPAGHRHGQMYYVPGHHPFVIQPTIGPDGKGTFDYPELALADLKRRAEAETDPEAMFQQGLVELYGVTGDPKTRRPPDFDNGMRWLRLAAAHGHAGANYEIYFVLTKYPDKAKPLDPNEANNCLQAAYSDGDPLAKDCVERTQKATRQSPRKERRRDERRRNHRRGGGERCP